MIQKMTDIPCDRLVISDWQTSYENDQMLDSRIPLQRKNDSVKGYVLKIDQAKGYVSKIDQQQHMRIAVDRFFKLIISIDRFFKCAFLLDRLLTGGIELFDGLTLCDVT